jgi:hypothetical protein
MRISLAVFTLGAVLASASGCGQSAAHQEDNDGSTADASTNGSTDGSTNGSPDGSVDGSTTGCGDPGTTQASGSAKLLNYDRMEPTQLRYAIFAKNQLGDYYTINLMNEPRTCQDITSWSPQAEDGAIKEQLAIHMCTLTVGEPNAVGTYPGREEFGYYCTNYPDDAIYWGFYRRTAFFTDLQPPWGQFETLSTTCNSGVPEYDGTGTDFVRIDEYIPGQSICGTFDLTFLTWGRISGRFHATFCDGEYDLPSQP